MKNLTPCNVPKRRVPSCGMQSGTNRPRTLTGRSPAELEGLFARGVPPDPPLDGRYDGALLHMTLGPGLGVLFARIADPWLPWPGKRFDAPAPSAAAVL